MILTADIGNTNTVFGLFKQSTLVATTRCETRAGDSMAYWQQQLESVTAIADEAITTLAYASVVPALNDELEQASKRQQIARVARLQAGNSGLQFEYGTKENIETIGADRLANVLAARDFYGPNILVIDFGTAITCCLYMNHVYQGGLIAAGVHTMINALVEKTAQLPPVNYKNSPPVLARNTIENMQAGAYFMVRGAITEIIKRYKKLAETQNPGSTLLVIATGGMVEQFDFASQLFDVIDKNLTLRGLMRFAQGVASR